jgi:phosphoribosylformylglycinamidine synthase subunit PurS
MTAEVGTSLQLGLADSSLNHCCLFNNYRKVEGFSLKQKYQARIYVTLRSSVLDPAGTAVQSGLTHMGYTDVESVRIGKYIEVSLSATDEAEAHQQLDTMCDQLLANPVIENYRIELEGRG